ncbi:MAG TPA: OmpA family protein [Bacteroidales bacterium]|nr:OmpA family protein [Bacteroidales bacterium]HCI55936.1 hypothetical protein [Bacteroidales bacterium]HOU96317.1 OmpA family protein [Bacteroidales bacterium]HQG37077.1 OmpA family protein [Bacteroidales bacterium]HQG52160.1 OmpA family protein [Bacteroidales bacterium]
MRVLITGFIAFVIWSFFSMWLYVDILKPATKRPVVISPAERPDMVADSLEKLRASMPEDLLIFFDFDKTEIKEDPSIDARVAELKTWLEKYPSAVLAITGHTDFIGTPEYNYKLGLERANAVRKYLETKGIPSEKMIVDSKGEDEPLATQITSKGRAMNRRTVVRIKM